MKSNKNLFIILISIISLLAGIWAIMDLIKERKKASIKDELSTIKIIGVIENPDTISSPILDTFRIQEGKVFFQKYPSDTWLDSIEKTSSKENYEYLVADYKSYFLPETKRLLINNGFKEVNYNNQTILKFPIGNSSKHVNINNYEGFGTFKAGFYRILASYNMSTFY